MKDLCVYMQLRIQMYIHHIDTKELSTKTGISYTSLRRKMKGETPFTLKEAKLIQSILNCGLSLDDLFAEVA